MTTFNFDPSTQMKGTAMKHVNKFGRQEVNHEHDKNTDPDKANVLTDPPRVIIQRVLKYKKRHRYKCF